MANEAATNHSQLALFSADTDKIKEYVFESAKLPEIRGASMILDDLNWGYNDKGRLPDIQVQRAIGDLFVDKGLSLAHWPDGNLVYAGGGSLLALVPLDVAEKLKAEIEALYASDTDTATITCIWRPVTRTEVGGELGGYTLERLLALREQLSPHEWQRIADYYHKEGETGDAITQEQFDRCKNFGELVALQGITLRRAKEGKSIAPFIEAVPYARRCDTCGARPATEFMPSPEPRYLCQVCATKFGLEKRGERKSQWIRRFEKFCTDRGNQVIARTPPDLEAIGQDSIGAAKNYIAFIYADGNEVGQVVESARSIAAYHKNSTALKQATEEATYQALLDHLAPRVKPDLPRPVQAFEIITIGGDDLLLIVPADAALLIARDICLEFERRSLKAGFESSEKPTMSAGVVIAESHTPIYFLRDLAEQLLKNAKKRVHELPDEKREGAIDFVVLKSQTTLATTLSHLRGAPPLLYTDREHKEKLYLTGRPYTLSELDKLFESVHALEGFPGSQIQGYRQALQRGRLGAAIYFLYQLARAKDKEEGKKLKAVFDRWNMMTTTNLPPWLEREPQRGYTRYWTPWADILEIKDFVPHSGHGKEAAKGGESRESSG